MGDIRLFSLKGPTIHEIEISSINIEKSLQDLIEKNMEILLGVRFLSSEHSTGKTHGGRIDSLGIDENNCPVIIEYKRSLNENVINQGLYYLDWLLDHKAEYHTLVRKKYNEKIADSIEWGNPRLLCIAADFTKYDVHAVSQIQRNIELIRYRKYGTDLLLLELVNVPHIQQGEKEKGAGRLVFSEMYDQSDQELQDLYDSLKAFMEAIGDDVQTRMLKYYVAFKRMKNFACVEIHPKMKELRVFIKIDPSSLTFEPGFIEDYRNIGHWGTGDVMVVIKSERDLDRAKELITKSYEAN